MRALPPLVSLLSFEALYRSGSVTGAAHLLGRTHSAVSKQLHQLQDHAGTSLFEKDGSGVRLTVAGKEFARVVATSLDEMRKAYDHLQSSEQKEKVSLVVSSTFARVWAIPTVSRFHLDHPDIEVQINLAMPQNFKDHDMDVDLVLSWDRLSSPMELSGNAISLGDVHIGPVLSPSYGFRIDDSSLAFKTLINRRGSEEGWKRWSELTGIALFYDSAIWFELSGLVFEAAEQSMGVALAPKFLIEKELKSGTLVAPAGFYRFRDGLIVRPSAERPKPKRNAQILLDWLSEHGRLGQDGYLAPRVIEPIWG